MKNLLYGLLGLLGTMPLQSLAQEKDQNQTLSPYFFVKSKDPNIDQMPLKHTSAEVNIAGVIADVKITQVYKNEGKNTLEAIYIFPGSTRAAVYAMTMTIGERKLIAKVEERQKARQEYEAAKEQGKTASLLEQQRPNVFQMNVANILPGDQITVELKYTELLIPTEGVYEFVYPTVVGPRYSETPANQASENEKWVENPYLKEGKKSNYTFALQTRLNAGMPIQEIASTSHKLRVNYAGKNSAQIDVDDSEKSGGNRDFILKYRLSGGQIQSGILLYEGENAVASGSDKLYENSASEKFFLLMMQPPQKPHNDQIPPREYVFIVDVSGSMNGFPLEVSKKLLSELISHLRPSDRFNVLLFESSNQMLSHESMPATKENIEEAIKVIDQQRGGGGTRLLPALKNALAFNETRGFSRSFVVVTDGYVTVEQEAFDLIRSNLNQANLFAFGIGSAVNRFLIEGMANAGMGEPFIVTHTDEAKINAQKFRQYIQNPVLTKINIDYGDFQVYDVEPLSIPDVFAERPVIVFGKYKGEPKGKITLRGMSGDKIYTESLLVTKAGQEQNQALRYLWARKKIQMLDDYNKLSVSFYASNYNPDELATVISSNEKNKERVKEITALGLKYNLLTAFTSFIAVDNEIRNKEGDWTTVNQPLPLPKGVSNYAVGDVKVKKGVNKTLSPEKYRRAFNQKELSGKTDELEITLEEKNVSENTGSATYPGGLKSLAAFIKKHLKYPSQAKTAQIKGKVIVEVIVHPDGSLSDLKVIQSLGYGCDEEAHRVVMLSSGKWTPAKSGKKAISSKVTVEVLFE